MEKKKVLFVVHQLNYGGVQKALLSALNAIDYDSFDVTLYVRKARLDLLPQVNPNVSRVIVNDDKIHYSRKPFSLWMTCRIKWNRLFKQSTRAETLSHRLSSYIAEQKIAYEKKRFFSDGIRYDAAVSYIQGYPAKLVADCVPADRKIMFFHGSTDELHELHESIFDRIDVIVGVNEGVQQVLRSLYPAYQKKIDYLQNYVDAAEVRSMSCKETVAGPSDRKILCSCGRFTPVKGFDLAVEAAKLMKDSGERFMWYFVGDGPERGRLEDMIRRYELEDSITITGMQANPYPWIKACDIYVQPSYEEAYGLSMAEALILCKPVVTTATVGGRILIRDGVNGLICDINSRAVAETVERLMNDPELAGQMVDLLSKADRSREFDVYRAEWSRILKG